MEEIKVWDPFVRLFHWTLVIAFFTAYLSGDDWESLHVIAGYTIGGLVLARLVWGVIGTRHARFTDFFYRPSEIRVATSGLFAYALREGAGPLAGWIARDRAMGRLVGELHEILANITLALVLLHIAAVLAVSVIHGENLVKSMWTGRKKASPHN